MKEKILIVDDNKTNARFIEVLLKREDNYSISIVNDGAEALEILKENQFDLIITDIIMPKIDGYELCEKVKKDKQTKEIPIIVITALSDTEDKVKALEYGADEFISKPFSSFELIARVKSILREKRYFKNIVKKNSRYEEELNMAKIVQQAILPKEEPVNDKVLFASKYLPAYYIGGDYYNYNWIDENKIGIFISDVMGHGVLSSLVTMLLKSNFDNLSEYYLNPSKLMEELNKRLYDAISDSMIYSTAVYAILDTINLELTYSFAGHPPIYRIDKCGKISSYKSKGGVLGLFENNKYTVESIKLQKEDIMILYTDGIIEVTNKDRIEFGEKKFFEEMKNAQTFEYPKDFIDYLVETLRLYGGKKEFEDDINLIVFKCI